MVTLAHLVKTLRDYPQKKTILIVAFGKEEEGLIGSHAFAESIPKEELIRYCAMINIDSLGLSGPQVADNMSSKKLGDLSEELAKRMKIPFGRARLLSADSDSTSFILRKIPAVTIHGLTNEWPKLLHSRADQASKINPTSVYLGYRLALALWSEIEEADCGAFQ